MVHYVNNNYLQEKVIVSDSWKEPLSGVIYFHDYHNRKPKSLSFASTYFPLKSFIVPSLLGFVGLSLIFSSFVSPVSIVSAGSRNEATYVTNYPPKLGGQTQPNQTNSAVVSTEEVKVVTEPVVATAPLANPSLGSIDRSTIDTTGFSTEKRWPVRGTITTYFSSYHQGIDLANPIGTQVHPFMEGVVVSVQSLSWGYGKHIIIRHADGYETLYAHLSSFNVVPGQKVDLETVIGGVGSTGYSTGPHLHFEIHQGSLAVNPLTVLP